MKRYIKSNTTRISRTLRQALDDCIKDANEGDWYSSVRVILDQEDIIYDGQSLEECKSLLTKYLDFACKYGWYDSDIEIYVFSPWCGHEDCYDRYEEDRYYSPSNPWDAPGMSVRDFF